MSRRGSSLFAQPGAGGSAPMAANGAAAAAPAGNAKRQSVVLQPMAGGIGLVDFSDDEYDSEEEEMPPQKSQPVPGGSGGGAGPGGPNHRPMVGGFAAAAYEAARSYHYQHKDKGKTPNGMPKRSNGRPPQS